MKINKSKKNQILFLSRPFKEEAAHFGEQSTANAFFYELIQYFKVDYVKRIFIKSSSLVISLLFYDWIYTLYFAFKNIFKKYELIIFNSPFQAPWIKIFKLFGSKTIVIVHDLFFIDNNLNGFFDKYSYLLYKMVLKSADFIISDTDEVQKDVITFSKKKSTVIYLGCNKEFGFFSEQYIKNKKVSYDIGYIGGYDKSRKRTDKIIQLLKENKNININYHFAGPITLEFQKELAQISSERCKYRIYGVISEVEKIEFFKRLCFIYFPSKLEGTGLPLVESFKSGVLPIVHSDAKIPSKIKSFCVTVNYPSEILEKIVFYCNNEKIFNNLIEINFEHSKNFNYSNFIKFINETYEKL